MTPAAEITAICRQRHRGKSHVVNLSWRFSEEVRLVTGRICKFLKIFAFQIPKFQEVESFWRTRNSSWSHWRPCVLLLFRNDPRVSSCHVIRTNAGAAVSLPIDYYAQVMLLSLETAMRKRCCTCISWEASFSCCPLPQKFETGLENRWHNPALKPIGGHVFEIIWAEWKVRRVATLI